MFVKRVKRGRQNLSAEEQAEQGWTLPSISCVGNSVCVGAGNNLVVCENGKPAQSIDYSSITPTGKTLRCVALNSTGNYVMISGEDKQAHLLRRSDLSKVASWTFGKRLSCIAFSADGQTGIIADKFGEVSSVKTSSDSAAAEKQSFVLGHMSIIQEVSFTPDNRYLISCDRDEKIRVSCFPEAYDIESFCLGHNDYVLRVVSLDESTIASVSGDGTLRLWNLHNAQQLASVTIFSSASSSSSSEKPPGPLTLSYSSKTQTLVASIEKSSEFLAFKYDPSAKTLTSASESDAAHPLKFAGHIIAAQYDADGDLWVVQAASPSVVCVGPSSAGVKSETASSISSCIKFDFSTLKDDDYPSAMRKKTFDDEEDEEEEGDAAASAEEPVEDKDGKKPKAQ